MVKVRRKGGWRASSLLAVLAVMVFLQGCAGGGMSGPFRLTVSVLDGNSRPLENAFVEVVGSELAAQVTDSNGQARFAELSGSIEILVRADGFASKTQTVRMDRNRSITIVMASGEADRPRFITVSEQAGRYFSFESGQVGSQPGGEDLKLTWVQFGSTYTLIGFEGCSGVRFSADDPTGADRGLLLEHFRTLTEEDWEDSDPHSPIRLGQYDTLLLKTNTGRFVKVFILALRGHWNHEDAPAVDFAYLFLDEVDLTPPTIESVTVVTESGDEITQAADGSVIEFELAEDPELIRFTLSEVAYFNRPLKRDNSGFEPSERVYFYPLGSAYFATEFHGAISTYGMSPPWSQIDLAAGDEEFYANFENDQGFFFSDLSGNELQELPFERIVIKRAQ